MRIFICEDDKEQRRKLEEAVLSILKIEDIDGEITLSTDSSQEILNYVSEFKDRGLYFLDINIGGDVNGIQLAKQINGIDKKAIIVIITSHKDMSHLTFKYHIGAIDYIIKESFEHITKRIKECILIANEKINNDFNNDYFFINAVDTIEKIKYDDILYFETAKKRFIALRTKNMYIEFSGTLKDIESKLDNRFIRCHKSYIINKSKVKSIDKKQRIITMDGGNKCYVSLSLLKKTINSIVL